MIEAAVRGILISDNDVKTLVDTRVYVGGKIPQGATLPLIVITFISHNGENHLKGAGNLQWERLQIEAWGETYSETVNVLKAVDEALNGNKFSSSDPVIASCVCQTGGSYVFQDAVNAHALSLDYGFWFKT